MIPSARERCEVCRKTVPVNHSGASRFSHFVNLPKLALQTPVLPIPRSLLDEQYLIHVNKC